MKYTLMTSFNEKYWNDVAKDNVKLFDQHWPAEENIYLFHQLPNQDSKEFSTRVKWFDLYKHCPSLLDFADKWKDDSRANGSSLKKNGFRWNAIKFAHKTYAIWEAAKIAQHGWLAWIDCDAFIFKKIDTTFLNTVFAANKQICYLGRKGKYSECGFMAFNLDNPDVKNFLREWEHIYVSGNFINLSETHDSFIFDHMRKIWQDQSIFFDLNMHSSTDKNPFGNSLLGTHMAHAKGLDKIHDTNKIKSRLQLS